MLMSERYNYGCIIFFFLPLFIIHFFFSFLFFLIFSGIFSLFYNEPALFYREKGRLFCVFIFVFKLVDFYRLDSVISCQGQKLGHQRRFPSRA